MNIVVYYPGDVSPDRGTPLRARNIAAALARTSNVNVTLRAAPHLQEDRTTREADFVYGITHNAMKPLLDLGTRAKRIIEFHGDPGAETLEGPGSRSRRWAAYLQIRAAEWRRIRRLDAATAVSRPLEERLQRFRVATTVLWGGVDIERFPRTSPPGSRSLRVVYAGNLRPYQGVEVLINAVNKLVDHGAEIELTLIGDPHGQRPPRETHINVIGQVPYEDIPSRLASADILVVPRPWSRTAQYGFPSKLPEYMASARAIVITDVGMHTELIQNMRTGLVIPPDSPDAMATALLKLQDEDLRRRLGDAARTFAEKELTWRAVAARLVRFLRTI